MQPPTGIWRSCSGEEGQEEEREKELFSSPSATGEENVGQIPTSESDMQNNSLEAEFRGSAWIELCLISARLSIMSP